VSDQARVLRTIASMHGARSAIAILYRRVRNGYRFACAEASTRRQKTGTKEAVARRKT